MSKRSKRFKGDFLPAKPERASVVSSVLSISRRGKKLILVGIGVVALGFWVLSYTDPAGQNWASTLSPFLIVAGYVLIGVGIVLPDPPAPTNAPSPETTASIPK
jgi:uncharacterized membrane protein